MLGNRSKDNAEDNFKMAKPHTGEQQNNEGNQEQDSESDDEEVIETSPCGRWEKHKKEVS